jgi:hypothetical protein
LPGPQAGRIAGTGMGASEPAAPSGPKKLAGRPAHLQNRAGQMAVGMPELIQDREVIGLDDRDQVAGKVLPRPVRMLVAAARDHGRQLAGAISDRQQLVDAGAAHGREGFDLIFRQLDRIVDMPGIAQRRELEHA